MSRGRDAGFTLLEVMLAVAIIATTVFALLYMRTRAIEHTTQARDMRATWAALQQLVGQYEEVKIDDVEEGTETGSLEEDTTVSWERVTEKIEMTMIEKVDDDHPRYLWRITLKVKRALPEGLEATAQAQWFRLLKEDEAQEPPPGGGGG